MSNAPRANNPAFTDPGQSTNEPPVLRNAIPKGPLQAPPARGVKQPAGTRTVPATAVKGAPNSQPQGQSMDTPTRSSDASGSAPKSPTAKAAPRSAPLRRASDVGPEGPTIDNVRELLLGDTLKKSRHDMALIERKTHEQLDELRVELGDRIDRVVRALSSVNQAVHKEFSAREQAVTETADALNQRTDELSSKIEDRLSFLEAKIYTVVADLERKVDAAQTAEHDKLVDQIAESQRQTEEKVTALTATVDQQLRGFGERIAAEIGSLNSELANVQAQAGEEAEALGSQVGKRLGAVESQLGSELAALREDIGKTSAQLNREMQRHVGAQQALLSKSQQETQAQLREHLQGLEGSKVSRADFSTLLQELATRLDESAD